MEIIYSVATISQKQLDQFDFCFRFNKAKYLKLCFVYLIFIKNRPVKFMKNIFKIIMLSPILKLYGDEYVILLIRQSNDGRTDLISVF